MVQLQLCLLWLTIWHIAYNHNQIKFKHCRWSRRNRFTNIMTGCCFFYSFLFIQEWNMRASQWTIPSADSFEKAQNHSGTKQASESVNHDLFEKACIIQERNKHVTQWAIHSTDSFEKALNHSGMKQVSHSFIADSFEKAQNHSGTKHANESMSHLFSRFVKKKQKKLWNFNM